MRRTLALLSVLALCACGAELREPDVMFRVSDDSGTLKLPLVGRDTAGKHYRLRKATFEVSGSAMLTLQARNQNDLYAPLPQGDYQMFLRPGFELVERDAQGGERVVSAELASPNPLRLHVAARCDGSVALAFRGEQGAITFGQENGVRARAGVDPGALAARAR